MPIMRSIMRPQVGNHFYKAKAFAFYDKAKNYKTQKGIISSKKHETKTCRCI